MWLEQLTRAGARVVLGQEGKGADGLQRQLDDLAATLVGPRACLASLLQRGQHPTLRPRLLPSDPCGSPQQTQDSTFLGTATGQGGLGPSLGLRVLPGKD